MARRAKEIALAQSEGWAGLRTVGDMAWAVTSVPGGEHLAWYEAQLEMSRSRST